MKFGDAKATLASWLGVNAKRFPDSVRGVLINLARRELCKRDLRFNEVEDTFATVAAQRAYALPAGWARPYQLWYVNPSTAGRVDVDYKLRDEFDRIAPDPTKVALPSVYTVWGPSLLLAKTPDRV